MRAILAMTPHEAAMTLEWVTGEFMLRWLERVPCVTIERFGAAWGACAPARPELDFHNTVHRLLPDDLEQVPRIAELYAAAGVRPWLELMPAPGFERLAAALREAGARQVDFLGVFERELPKTPSSYAPAIDILQPPPDIEEFSTVLLTGHGLSKDQLTSAMPLNTPMAAVEGATLYLATVDGRPAAAGALFVHNGIGHLANASTMPGYRGLGCQIALIERRLQDRVHESGLALRRVGLRRGRPDLRSSPAGGARWCPTGRGGKPLANSRPSHPPAGGFGSRGRGGAMPGGIPCSDMAASEPAASILVVDGDPGVVTGLTRELKHRYGRDYLFLGTLTAQSGLGILERLDAVSRPVALVIAGLRLPDMPGPEFLSRVRTLHPLAKRTILVSFLEFGSSEVLHRAVTLGQAD